jgi:hypothetical protein
MAAKLSVLAGVEQDLAAIAERDSKLATSALAAMALQLARQLDSTKTSATSKSMCSAQLRDTLDRLRELAPPAQGADRLDEVTKKRDQRRRRSAEA